MTLETADRALQGLAAVLSILVARRRADHRAVSLFLCSMTLAGAARAGVQIGVLHPARDAILARGLDPAAVPFTGLARVAGHLEQALFLLWPAALAALAITVFLQRSPYAVLLPYLLVVAALILGYPSIRGDLLRRVYLAAELAALTVAVGSVVTWARRREAMTIPRFCALSVIGIDCGTLIGPYLGDPFTSWERAQALYLVLYATLTVLQGGVLWLPSSTSRSG